MRTKTLILGIFTIILAMVFHNFLWAGLTLFLPFLETHPIMDAHIPLIGTNVEGLLKAIIIGLLSMVGFRITLKGLAG